MDTRRFLRGHRNDERTQTLCLVNVLFRPFRGDNYSPWFIFVFGSLGPLIQGIQSPFDGSLYLEKDKYRGQYDIDFLVLW